MMGPTLGAGLTSVVSQLPLLVVALVGLGFAIVGWRKHPRVSLLAVLALGLLMLNVVAGVVLTSLPPMLLRRGMTGQQLGVVFGMIGLVRGLISAASYGLLSAAAFSGQ
jgi:hypothetical protein